MPGWGGNGKPNGSNDCKRCHSVTFAVDVSERQHLLGLSPPHDLLQLSKEKLATIIPSSRIRHAAVDYNGGDTMLVILSI